MSIKADAARTAINDAGNKMLGAMHDWLKRCESLQSSPRPETFPSAGLWRLGERGQPIAGIRHATMLYSYLLRPTTANHAFAEVVLRHLNRTLSGAPGEHADFLLRLAPVLRAEVEKQSLVDVYEKIDLPLAPVLARMEAAGVRVDRKELEIISAKAEEEIARLEKSIYELAGFEFKINSPQQLAEVLFDRLNLQPPAPEPRQVAIDGGGGAGGTGADYTSCPEKFSNTASLPS